MTALRPMKITIRKKLIVWYLEWKKFGSTPRFCKFHPRQMWCKPFLSPPKMCRFFAKQIVMWATFQSIGLQGCKKPVSSPTFGASSLNQWNVGCAPLVKSVLYSSQRILEHKCEVKTHWDWSRGVLYICWNRSFFNIVLCNCWELSPFAENQKLFRV